MNFFLLSFHNKIAFAAVLLLLLYLMGDDNFNVIVALRRHDPSARIFRSLFQIQLILWCTACSFYVWEKIVTKEMLADLLQVSHHNSSALSDSNSYNHLLQDVDDQDFVEQQQQDRFDDSEYGISASEVSRPIEDFAFAVKTNSNSNGSNKIIHSKEHNVVHNNNDADYESDGEIQEENNSDNVYQLDLPSLSNLVHTALNLLLLILMTLFFFYLCLSASKKSFNTATSHWWFLRAAPTFPLLLFGYVVWHVVYPWKNVAPFWKLISLTMTAPLHKVTFRDGLIGDVLTSVVRPAQDLAFTLFYVLFGLQGWWNVSASSLPALPLPRGINSSPPTLESSWLLHTVVLPMCMVSPLWWRFLQTLRQCYDAKQRWPFLGNAAKYFIAAQVAMIGVFHPERQTTTAWLVCYVIATLYQIWWDIFMDWGLLEFNNETVSRVAPIQFQIRSRRLYQPNKTWMYWTICVLNILFRFGWILTFLPPHYLDATGVLRQTFGELSFFTGSLIASVEIVRRTIWGWLRLEWEAIKCIPNATTISSSLELSSNQSNTHQHNDSMNDLNKDVLEMIPMNVQSFEQPALFDLSFISRQSSWVSPTAMTNMAENIHLMGELCLYATFFCILGALAAAHRGTL